MLVLLRHERRGPTFEVHCRQLEHVSPEQTQLFYKHGSGWQWIQSTPYALSRHEVDGLDNYVSRYTLFYLSEIVNDGSWLGQDFAEAKRNVEVSVASEPFVFEFNRSLQDPLMWLALRLWAANRLLMKGWEISGEQTLGMCNVTDVSSYLFDTILAPRVLQNQLDRNIELYIAKTELELLKALQNAMLQIQPHT